MPRFIRSLPIVAAVMLTFAQTSLAQSILSRGSVFVPQSSIEHPEDIGVRSHTNIMIKVVNGSLEHGLMSQSLSTGAPPFPNFAVETPASLGCVYRLVSTIVAGCNPNTVTENPTGGSKTIAIVNAFDDPNAMNDLNTFSTQFGLPAATSSNFSVAYASGTKPGQDPTGGWEAEESLDIEWVHAMAPDAKIILVEAASESLTDLLAAVVVASDLVNAAGGGEVSMSWGFSEFSTETLTDPIFTTTGVVYIAAAGDSAGVDYPSASPNVIAAGGTTVRRNPFDGNLIGQGTWQDTGGGPSVYESRPAFQNAIKSAFPLIVRGQRGTPDLSFDSDPDTGVWIYDSIPISGAMGVEGSNWFVFGGTSVAAQALAGIINVGGRFLSSSTLELNRIYYHGTMTNEYHDIVSGNCGPCDGFSATAGWDYCTGVGSPIGYDGK